MLVMMVGLLSVSGCAPYTAKNITVQGWTRKDASVRQMQLDYQTCSGLIYIKEGIRAVQNSQNRYVYPLKSLAFWTSFGRF